MLLRFILTLCLVGAIVVSAQSSVTVAEVISLAEAKIPDSIIINKIRAGGKTFQLTTDELIRLKKAGASEAVLLAMVGSGAPAATETPRTEPQQTAGSSSPFTEVGVYHKKNGQWMEVLPEVVNWKTGGTLKGLASAGIIKKDINGHIQGQHSRTSAAPSLEFTIYAPEGAAITEYQLIRLRSHPEKDYREFRTITGGVFNQKSGAMRDMIAFEGTKVGNRLYAVTLPSTIAAGEYGFVFLGATGGAGNLNSMSLGKMYTFRLLD